MNLKKIISIYILFLTIFLYGSNDEFAIVNSPNGLIFRKSPSISSVQLFYLIDKTNLIILEKGIPDTIEGKSNNWYKVQIGNDIGWVFGGYISKQIPDNYKIKYLISSVGNSTAIIYLSLYKNKEFDLYFESMLVSGRNFGIFKGKWELRENDILLKFNKIQNINPQGNIKYLFMNQDNIKWDENIKVIDDYSYAFDKSLDGISLWGVRCMKYEYNR